MNIAKAKAMLAKVNSKAGNPLIFKLAAGENKIRIVPLEANPDIPFQVLHFHYIGGKTILSPISYGQPDPLAEFSDNLVSEGQLTKDEYKKAKSFSPQPRTFLPIVERGKEKEGIKYWAFGKKTTDELMALFENEEYGDISDVVKGVDLTINFTPGDKAKGTFPTTSIVASRKESPLHTDPAVVKNLTTNQPDLLGSYDKHTYDQLKSMLNNVVETAAAQEAAQDSANEESEPVTEVEATEEVPVAKTASEKDFDEVFNS